jgi:hypothetical protein
MKILEIDEFYPIPLEDGMNYLRIESQYPVKLYIEDCTNPLWNSPIAIGTLYTGSVQVHTHPSNCTQGYATNMHTTSNI